jgi:hypothetical protein
MKYRFLLFCLMFILPVQYVFSQQKIIDFTGFKPDPVMEVAKHVGEKITVFGSIHQINSKNSKRTLIIGVMGEFMKPPDHPTTLKILIFKTDIDKFRNVKDSALIRSTAFITGKVIRYRGELVLRLKNRSDLEFDKHPKDAPQIR